LLLELLDVIAIRNKGVPVSRPIDLAAPFFDQVWRRRVICADRSILVDGLETDAMLDPLRLFWTDFPVTGEAKPVDSPNFAISRVYASGCSSAREARLGANDDFLVFLGLRCRDSSIIPA
jgi:hypothetical protein